MRSTLAFLGVAAAVLLIGLPARAQNVTGAVNLITDNTSSVLVNCLRYGTGNCQSALPFASCDDGNTLFLLSSQYCDVWNKVNPGYCYSYLCVYDPSSTTETGPMAGTSRTCSFSEGPRAGQIQLFAGAAPIPIGSECQDGVGSSGVTVADRQQPFQP